MNGSGAPVAASVTRPWSSPVRSSAKSIPVRSAAVTSTSAPV
jgi:hypothetical protein